MRKIPTIFERDWNHAPNLVLNERNPACSWVFDGLGQASRKLDGTCCMISDDQKLYKRRELKESDKFPEGFIVEEIDNTTKKVFGWVPCMRDAPEDKYHFEAYDYGYPYDRAWVHKTYELVGPKVQGNPEKVGQHMLIPHCLFTFTRLENVPTEYDALKDWLSGQNIEGVVWHGPDGKMAKIKLKDFGLKRVSKNKEQNK